MFAMLTRSLSDLESVNSYLDSDILVFDNSVIYSDASSTEWRIIRYTLRFSVGCMSVSVIYPGFNPSSVYGP